MTKIYAACLASYNAGTLFGEWIDATQSEDDILRGINAMLRKSPNPNVTRRDYRCESCGVDFMRTLSDFKPEQREDGWIPPCAECDDATDVKPIGAPYHSAEEWAIHDHEGFEGIEIGEHDALSDIVALAEALDKHGEEFAAYRNYVGKDYATIQKFEEAYRGTYKSAADYVAEFHEETGAEIPENLVNYIDWEKMARDWDMSGDIHAIELGYNRVAIFDGHA